MCSRHLREVSGQRRAYQFFQDIRGLYIPEGIREQAAPNVFLAPGYHRV